MIAYALSVGVKDTRVGIGMCAFEPVEEGRLEIETDACVVVYDPLDAAAIVSYAGQYIGTVTVGVNPFVPVMKR
jgi:hypothetical protein